MNKEELEIFAGEAIVTANQIENPVQKFCEIWKSVKRGLELAKKITGPKIDIQIDRLIYAADKVCTGEHVDVQNYCKVYNDYNVKQFLKTIQIITGPNVDKALNIIIEISDNLCPDEL